MKERKNIMRNIIILSLAMVILTGMFISGCGKTLSDDRIVETCIEAESLTDYSVVSIGDTITLCYKYWAPGGEHSEIPSDGELVVRTFYVDVPLQMVAGEDTVEHEISWDIDYEVCYDVYISDSIENSGSHNIHFKGETKESPWCGCSIDQTITTLLRR